MLRTFVSVGPTPLPKFRVGSTETKPYTPTAQTPFMTPYHTPHHTPHHTQTPRYGSQTPGGGPMPPPSQPMFVHPGALTPSHRTPSQRSNSTPTHMPTPPQQQFVRSVTGRSPSRSPKVLHSPSCSLIPARPPSPKVPAWPPSLPPNPVTFSGARNNMPSDPMDWRKAAEEWAKRKQRENSEGTPRSDTRSTPRQGGSTPARYDDGRRITPRYDEGRSSNSRNTQQRGPRHSGYKPSPKQPYDQSPQVYDSGKSPRLPQGSGPYDPYGLGTKSPRYLASPRSGRSTPRTINSPRSMIDSSIGDATPLYDEN